MELKDILKSDTVRSEGNISSKKRMLMAVADQAERVHGMSAEAVFAALQAREELGSTGVGRGVAIPHARFDDLDKVLGFFTRLERPIDFDSVDGQPVDLIFTLLAPAAEGAEHLKALALVSRTMRNEDFCARLRANNSDQTLFTLLVDQSSVRAA